MRAAVPERVFSDGAGGVEGKEAGVDFVAGGVRPAVGLLLDSGGLVDLVVEEEVAVGGEVGPAIGVEDGAVHGYFAFRSKSVLILLIPAALAISIASA